MNRPTHIIVHCSDSPGGCASLIDEDHRHHRGFSAIGYHYLLLNGRRDWGGLGYDPAADGLVERGRPEDQAGAHCLGFNERSLGVCLIGGWKGRQEHFSEKQLDAAAALVRLLMAHHHIPLEHVLGHNETDSGRAANKRCPVLDMMTFRESLQPQLPKGAAP